MYRSNVCVCMCVHERLYVLNDKEVEAEAVHNHIVGRKVWVAIDAGHSFDLGVDTG